MDATHAPSAQPGADQPIGEVNKQTAHLYVESRPARLIAARYTHLPFPIIAPVQEIAFDLGITAMHEAISLNGIVIECYNDHQLLSSARRSVKRI